MPIFRRRRRPTPETSPAQPPADPTRRVNINPEQIAAGISAQALEGGTRLVERSVLDDLAGAVEHAVPAPQSPSRLVVGWLVVTYGAGRGQVASLYAGANRIGRGDDSQIRLDAGAATIPEGDDVVVEYKPGQRRFYVFCAPGGSLKVNGVALHKPMELRGGEFLSLGDDIRLRFVRLCDEHFDWEGGV